jgi:hypothetical protein
VIWFILMIMHCTEPDMIWTKAVVIWTKVDWIKADMICTRADMICTRNILIKAIRFEMNLIWFELNPLWFALNHLPQVRCHSIPPSRQRYQMRVEKILWRRLAVSSIWPIRGPTWTSLRLYTFYERTWLHCRDHPAAFDVRRKYQTSKGPR